MSSESFLQLSSKFLDCRYTFGVLWVYTLRVSTLSIHVSSLYLDSLSLLQAADNPANAPAEAARRAAGGGGDGVEGADAGPARDGQTDG